MASLSGWQDDEKWSVKQKQLDKIKIHNYFTTTKKDKRQQTQVLQRAHSSQKAPIVQIQRILRQ